MCSLLHLLMLSLAVHLPRVLPRRWAQSLLVRLGEAASRRDWQKYSAAHIRVTGQPRRYSVDLLAWNDAEHISGLNERDPFLVYLWRCTTPYETDYDRLELLGLALAKRCAELDAKWARMEAEWADAMAADEEAEEEREKLAWEAELAPRAAAEDAQEELVRKAEALALLRDRSQESGC